MKYKHSIILFFIGFVFIGLNSCEINFDYSPYVIDFSDNEKQVHLKNLNKLIEQNTNDDTLRIAFTGDSHRFYDELNAFTQAVNSKNFEQAIDLVIHVGDLADFGLPLQYQWGNNILKQLEIPYFVVVGNHDLVGNGLSAYKEMFGTIDLSFIYRGIKFIFLNTNSREFNFDGSVPNLKWLNNEIQPSPDFTFAIVIFHVPPGDADFDTVLESDFEEILSLHNNVIFTAHGHLHGYEYYRPYSDSIPYVNVYGVENNKFNLIKIIGHDFMVETHSF
ncbi:metallophosphoesterase family protein [Carboxylicivirga caseinilyticus]|uniref:metallophosphoesterase family protein n=1 Tax=Carboxylicivirga caseinilyticus TaxID=3417572 RepID=UPI002AA758A2|nr:metallophosphoesterase [uncultured Carboxylicivirga sp.]MCU4165742.1 metallophosphoesterase [Marinilabiliaceae bacterium A049]